MNNTVIVIATSRENGRSYYKEDKIYTQLSLTNRATRLEVSQVTKHGTVRYVPYGFLLLSYNNFVREGH